MVRTTKDQATREPDVLRQVFGPVYISQNAPPLTGNTVRYFQLPRECKYIAYCDDFGPMNLASVFDFSVALNTELEAASEHAQKVIFKVESGKRALSNAVFLVGAYMILEQGKSVNDVVRAFSWLDETMVEGFRDASFSPVNFELSVADCWRGLALGMSKGWIRSLGSAEQPGEKRFVTDLKVYRHFDNPLNGDLHVVVPGKFVAFAGPVDLEGGVEYFDDERGFRSFSPGYYARMLKLLGVTDVVQLNFSAYDTTPFAAKGITHHRLSFPDCTCPSEDIVDAFLRIVDSARGLVAVHCRAGLGRTGTLIARHLMRSHGFGACEAIGWLRVMRPGSVIGSQQHYLCAVDSACNNTPETPEPPSLSEAPCRRASKPAAPSHPPRASEATWPRPVRRDAPACRSQPMADVRPAAGGCEGAAAADERHDSRAWNLKTWLLPSLHWRHQQAPLPGSPPAAKDAHMRAWTGARVDLSRRAPLRPLRPHPSAAADDEVLAREAGRCAAKGAADSCTLAEQVRLGMAARGAARAAAHASISRASSAETVACEDEEDGRGGMEQQFDVPVDDLTAPPVFAAPELNSA